MCTLEFKSGFLCLSHNSVCQCRLNASSDINAVCQFYLELNPTDFVCLRL